jgi:hypothetical protein
MSIKTYLPPSFSARNLQPLVGFRASLTRPRLDSTGPVADSKLPDCSKQDPVVRCCKAGQPNCDPFGPYLHGMFEASTDADSRLPAAPLGPSDGCDKQALRAVVITSLNTGTVMERRELIEAAGTVLAASPWLSQFAMARSFASTAKETNMAESAKNQQAGVSPGPGSSPGKLEVHPGWVRSGADNAPGP